MTARFQARHLNFPGCNENGQPGGDVDHGAGVVWTGLHLLLSKFKCIFFCVDGNNDTDDLLNSV